DHPLLFGEVLGREDLVGAAVLDEEAAPAGGHHSELRGGGQQRAGAASYIRSIMSLYFSSTTRRFTLRVGVSSPPSSENSRGRSVIFLICSNFASSPVTSFTSCSQRATISGWRTSLSRSRNARPR